LEKRKNIFGISLAELEIELMTLKKEKFRAKQIAEWLYKRCAADFSQMTNLSLELREKLAEKFLIAVPKEKAALHSADGRTTKYLLSFADGAAIETVLMRQPYGNSICVSTQAGCNMGCAFCASTLNGLDRNLTSAEILGQVIHIQRELLKEGEKVDSIVIMGSGEPLANYDNVLAFLRFLHEPYCLNFSYRNIAVSTSGIVPKIYDLMKENIPVTLSISLHAPNDELRSKIMPINEKFPLAELVKAGGDYGAKTGRRVTYEYILIDKLNDTPKCADELAALLRGQIASVNLIPINPVKERGFLKPPKKSVDAFLEHLAKKHITATVRREMGADIQAACGQLRNKVEFGN
jgi:23S rRNA (adenine2503-C2)-methyltransferase